MSGGIYEHDGLKYYGDGKEVDSLAGLCRRCIDYPCRCNITTDEIDLLPPDEEFTLP